MSLADVVETGEVRLADGDLEFHLGDVAGQDEELACGDADGQLLQRGRSRSNAEDKEGAEGAVGDISPLGQP